MKNDNDIRIVKDDKDLKKKHLQDLYADKKDKANKAKLIKK